MRRILNSLIQQYIIRAILAGGITIYSTVALMLQLVNYFMLDNHFSNKEVLSTTLLSTAYVGLCLLIFNKLNDLLEN